MQMGSVIKTRAMGGRYSVLLSTAPWFLKQGLLVGVELMKIENISLEASHTCTPTYTSRIGLKDYF